MNTYQLCLPAPKTPSSEVTLKTYAIDFECYCGKHVSITSQGVYHYLHDPLCDICMVAVYSTAEGFSYIGHPRDLDWEQFSAAHFVAHNAGFDKACFARLQELGIIPAHLSPLWDCTADLAAFLGSGRSLAAASEELLSSELQKSAHEKMEGKMWADARELGLADELSGYCMDQAKRCYQLWCDYSTQWLTSERELSQHTRLMCERGVYVDKKKLDAGIKALDFVRLNALLLIPWAGCNNPLSQSCLRDACIESGIKVPKSLTEDSPECAAWEEEYGSQFPWVDAMRQFRRSDLLLNKLKALQSRIRPDGTFSYGLKYCGAHTGRWSADAGFNIQNLPRKQSFGVDLRSMLTARPNKVFVISDLRQIEQRVLAWLAGDNDMMEQLATGISVYEAHARATMGWDQPEELKHANPDLYRLAKARVLGLGYGAGASVFVQIAKTMAGLDIPLAEAKSIVSDFRHSNPLITSLWLRLERAFKARRGGDFKLPLPSGRFLHYRNVESSPKGIFASVRGKRTSFFGAKLAENLTSAVARDVLAEAILRIEAAGYPVIMHIHDEVVVEVDLTDAESALHIVEQLLITPPAWLEGLPLLAESFISPHYTK